MNEINKVMRQCSVICIALVCLVLCGCSKTGPTLNGKKSSNPLIYVTDMANSTLHKSATDAESMLLSDGWYDGGLPGKPARVKGSTSSYQEFYCKKKVGVYIYEMYCYGEGEITNVQAFVWSMDDYNVPDGTNIIKELFKYMGSSYKLNTGTVCDFSLGVNNASKSISTDYNDVMNNSTTSNDGKYYIAGVWNKNYDTSVIELKGEMWIGVVDFNWVDFELTISDNSNVSGFTPNTNYINDITKEFNTLMGK